MEELQSKTLRRVTCLNPQTLGCQLPRICHLWTLHTWNHLLIILSFPTLILRKVWMIRATTSGEITLMMATIALIKVTQTTLTMGIHKMQASGWNHNQPRLLHLFVPLLRYFLVLMFEQRFALVGSW
jgi:hypothetical protein